jgi:hypothetical protein
VKDRVVTKSIRIITKNKVEEIKPYSLINKMSILVTHN